MANTNTRAIHFISLTPSKGPFNPVSCLGVKANSTKPNDVEEEFYYNTQTLDMKNGSAIQTGS